MGTAVKNERAVDSAFIDGIARYLEPLDKVDRSLALSLARYVIDATDEDALGKLLSNTTALDCLADANPYAGRCATSGIFAARCQVPPDVWMRLGRLFETAVSRSIKAGYSSVYGGPAEWPGWLSSLLTHMALNLFQIRNGGKLNPEDFKKIDERDNSQPSIYFRSMLEFENVLVEESLSDSLFVEPLLSNTWNYVFFGYQYGYESSKCTMTDVDTYLNKHSADVLEFLKKANSDGRIHAFGKLKHLGFDCSTVLDYLVEIATGTSKTLRESVLPLVLSQASAAQPYVQRVLADGDASQRNEAASLLYRLDNASAVPILRQHSSAEKSEKVKQTIEKLLMTYQADADSGHGKLPRALPACDVEVGVLPLPTYVLQHLRKHFDEVYAARFKNYEQMQKNWDSTGKHQYVAKPVKPEPLRDDFIETIVEFVEGRSKSLNWPADSHLYLYSTPRNIQEWLKPPDIKLAHVVRLAYALRLVQPNKEFGSTTVGSLWWRDPSIIENYRSRCDEKFGLRELDLVLGTLPDFEKGLFARTYLTTHSSWGIQFDWEPEAIWPLFAEHESLLVEALLSAQTTDYYLASRRYNTFRVLKSFPELPAHLAALVWDVALGETKTDRCDAQTALHTVPNRFDKIVAALSDGKQGVRAAAAEWLGRLGDKRAIDSLKKAFMKEKNEVAKGIIMQALDNLGADVDEFLDRDRLLKEAQDGMSKKLPKGMEWVSLDLLPALHWQDNGQKVDPSIVQWWVVQSIQQKSPSCGPVLRRYLSMCKPIEAQRFAQYILSLWISYDTETVNYEEAAARARADSDASWAQYSGQAWFVEMHKGQKENLYRTLLNSYSSELLHSAIEQKGMLAIVSAAGDGDCVKMCDRYIRKYYGTKLAQCKSLIEVLSWIDHPLALQALLAFANRFRTKSIKQQAEIVVQEIADRQGWTIDELADRTIPDAGFARPVDENGQPVGDEAVLELDYGPRQFEVRLSDKLEPVIIAKGESKPLKALPAPGKSDDPELAKEAKKEFADAKKVAKEVVKRQSERLYEALCTQRAWRFADWKMFLAGHPIVGRLCVRLAWAAFEKPQQVDGELRFVGCFRPLEDGSLTNECDEEVKLPDDTIVRLAHSGIIPDEVGASWLKHFDDYDVTPLFQQFGKAKYVLPQEKANEHEISDFRGHMITTFKLRGKATKLGYIRGDAEDGGCFTHYRKPFSSLALQAVIEFTGSYLPEEDIPAALLDLTFTNIPGAGGESASYFSASAVPLSKVPPVLLSEVYSDLKQIAAEGSGFDPKWQENSYF